MEHLIDESNIADVTDKNINSNDEDTLVEVKNGKNKKNPDFDKHKEESMFLILY